MKKCSLETTLLEKQSLFSKKYRHVWFLLVWVSHLVLYAVTEKLIPYEKCVPVHLPLDDLIPFCELFVIPYVGWYALIVGSTLYMMWKSPENFKGMMTFVLIFQIIAFAIYVLFPNRQDLRPDVLPRENVLTALMQSLYTADTSTNVCPSVHVGYSIAFASAFLKEKTVKPYARLLITVFCILICLSVVFVKQHSALDIIVALPVCLLAEILAYGKSFWLPRFKK